MTVTSTEALGGIVIDWKGPFRWCNGGPDGFFSSEYARASGVYLMTAPWNDGYLVWGPGITARPFAQRFLEHTKEFLAGTYNILDASALVQGQRVLLWHGLWYKKDRLARLDEFLARYADLAPHVAQLLSTLRIFVCPMSCEMRLLERIEAAIVNALYTAGPPMEEIPDRGLALRPRRANESAVTVMNRAPVTLHGIPRQFQV